MEVGTIKLYPYNISTIYCKVVRLATINNTVKVTKRQVLIICVHAFWFSKFALIITIATYNKMHTWVIKRDLIPTALLNECTF